MGGPQAQRGREVEGKSSTYKEAFSGGLQQIGYYDQHDKNNTIKYWYK